MKTYSSDFFDSMTKGAMDSAKIVFSELFNFYRPASILDVGSGRGAWTLTFTELVETDDYLALDGAYVKKEELLVPTDNFKSMELSKPFDLQKKFDLVISMEVAEHLPEKSAKEFVSSLTRHGDVILFSAAIPGQRGTFHINEQFPEYWESFFNKEGFVAKDCIRDKIWSNTDVEAWYRQNTLVFVKESKLNEFPKFEKFKNGNARLTQIHPEILKHNVELGNKLDSFWEFVKYRLYFLKLKFKGIR